MVRTEFWTIRELVREIAKTGEELRILKTLIGERKQTLAELMQELRFERRLRPRRGRRAR
jgi:hypothetical protein